MRAAHQNLSEALSKKSCTHAREVETTTLPKSLDRKECNGIYQKLTYFKSS